MRHHVAAFLTLAYLLSGHPSRVLASPPQTDYMLHCMGCHLADGSATPKHIPALLGMDRFLSVPGGREYLIRVPGVALSILGDQELAELMNWLLLRFGSPAMEADPAPYTAAEVAEYRARPYTGVDSVRMALIAAIDAQQSHTPFTGIDPE